MATVKGPLQIEGAMGNMSFYTRRGSDKIIVRSKGGASKRKIKTSPAFANLRLSQQEWKGCTGFTSVMRHTLGLVIRIADYNLAAGLNAFAKNLQKTDENAEKGKRNIRLSRFRYTLDGFNFNRTFPFNSVVRVAPIATIHRETLSASVKIPRINTGIDLLNIQRLPFFRLSVSLGVISDILFSENIKSYEPVNRIMNGLNQTVTGEWFSSENILPEQIMEVSLPDGLIADLTDDVTLVVGIAVEFGKVGFTGQPQEVKYAGSGKVLVCG
ncbi:MAG: hypothetical protein ACYC2P_05795 [Paludibacteraceae bacterium]